MIRAALNYPFSGCWGYFLSAFGVGFWAHHGTFRAAELKNCALAFNAAHKQEYKMTRFSVRLFGFLALLSLIGTPVLAQSTAPGEDPVVARVNGKEIRQSDVVIGLATLPPQ